MYFLSLGKFVSITFQQEALATHIMWRRWSHKTELCFLIPTLKKIPANTF